MFYFWNIYVLWYFEWYLIASCDSKVLFSWAVKEAFYKTILIHQYYSYKKLMTKYVTSVDFLEYTYIHCLNVKQWSFVVMAVEKSAYYEKPL